MTAFDVDARAAYDADPAPEGLASARIAVAHIEHHGQPVRWQGTSYQGDVAAHRFACHAGCGFAVEVRVTLPPPGRG